MSKVDDAEDHLIATRVLENRLHVQLMNAEAELKELKLIQKKELASLRADFAQEREFLEQNVSNLLRAKADAREEAIDAKRNYDRAVDYQDSEEDEL